MIYWNRPIGKWLWGFLYKKNLCGRWWIRGFYKPEWKRDRTIYFIELKTIKYDCGVSLFPYIFLTEGYLKDESIVWHEIGHCVQAWKWGLLYLPVIGLASFIRAALSFFGLIKKEDYYKAWPENEATRLGEEMKQYLEKDDD